jgi:hypothetical protein
VPSTFQAALIFALLISPGYVLIQGYRRGRSYSIPDRDLYVLAQAVVASLGWVAAIWFLQSLAGNPISHWGVVPQDNLLLSRHQAGIALLVLGVEFAPFPLGLTAGLVVDALQSNDSVRAGLHWTGLFEPPTAWEHAWNEAARRAENSGQGWFDISIRLKSGAVITGRYGAKSRADLSPHPAHQIFLETAYGPDGEGASEDGTIGGVFIDASEIATIYFAS